MSEFDWLFGPLHGIVVNPGDANNAVRPRYPNQRPGDLSASQIEWCEKHLLFEGRPVFKLAREAVQKIDAEVRQNREAMGR
jgi:hypothetical protein